MESVAGQMIVVHSRINKFERKSQRVYLRGFGDKAEFEDKDLGWFMHIEGSHEALHIGFDEPPFKPGEYIKITFQRMKDE